MILLTTALTTLDERKRLSLLKYSVAHNYPK
jgi:hypothetical protein